MQELEKPIVIITGSSGFIGRAVREKIEKDYKIIGFDHKLPEDTDHIETYQVDVSSSMSIANALNQVARKYGRRIASVIHLAAYYSFDEKESPLYDKITVRGTENLLAHLKDFNVEQFVFSSTMLVHKPVDLGSRVHESSEVEPSWAYPASKVAAEKILKKQHGEIPLVNLRIAGVYNDNCHSIPISNQIMRIYENQMTSHFYPGNTEKGQSFLHVEDLAAAIQNTIHRRALLPPSVDLLLGEPDVMSYDEVQDEVGHLIYQQDWDVMRVPNWFARMGAWVQQHTPFIRKPFIKPWMISFADDHYALDISKAEKLLGWRPQHSLRSTLPKMIERLKQDPVGWYKLNNLQIPNKIVRAFGGLPGDLAGFQTPDRLHKQQFNALNLLNLLWGAWLIANSVSHGYTSTAMLWSDVISGALVMLFSALSMLMFWTWPRWASVVVGLWVMFAPLAFWSNAAGYLSGSLLGALIVLCGGLQPITNVSQALRQTGNPRGWDYNPSAWSQRVPIIILAFIGFFIARYMAAFQLEHNSTVWDPFFGGQTAEVLTSDISKAFIVSDAGLGAYFYLLDALTGLIGDTRRWRTMPWVVMVFGLMIVPPGVTSIALVILQPVGVGAWCFLCLVTAGITLLMVAPALDEIVASIQFLHRSVKAGRPFWKTFLLGDQLEPVVEPVPRRTKAASLLETMPIGLIGTTIIGSALMFFPSALDFGKPASDFVYFMAALIITFAVIALSEVARPMRFLSAALAFILAVGIWFFENAGWEAQAFVAVTSVLIIMQSLPMGKVVAHFGTYDRWARWTPFRTSS